MKIRKVLHFDFLLQWPTCRKFRFCGVRLLLKKCRCGYVGFSCGVGRWWDLN